MRGDMTMTSDEVRAWLIDRVAYHLDRDPARIRPDVPLADYGLDSVYAMGVSGDIEDEFGIAVEAADLWERPTIDALAAHLVDQVGG
ncbi:acyl carrier protein [Solihabitans fulvus]|uniref:Acyl carrier protein n=1 Tax=Solihabitans fulvus TaxID=1892852 RepID=A0A5B2WJ65_9PSEU|nr:acyl carrier protein [Solihabitans fulvus]KAA2250732.1 acyl carrier protein [Solihabitans fulvus]